MAIRKNFSFRYEWSERIAHLSETVQYEILIGTVAYAKNGEFSPCASPEARSAFEEFILPDFIKRAKAAEYRARAKARKAAELAKSIEPVAAEEAPATEAAPETESEAATAVPKLSRSARRRLARKQMKLKRRGHKKSPGEHHEGTFRV